jgi:hypothetical protein
VIKALPGGKQIASAFMATAVMITATDAAPRYPYPYNHYAADSNCMLGVKNHYMHANKRLRLFYLQKCREEKAAIIQNTAEGK